MSEIKERNNDELMIPPELNIELAKPEYLDDGLLELQPYDTRRFMIGNDRYYFKVDEETGEPSELAASVTTIKNMFYKGFDLSQWKINSFPTHEHYKMFMNAAADYGTFVHMMCARLAIIGELNLDLIDMELEVFVEERGLRYNPYFNIGDARRRAKKAVLSFCQFIKDRNVTILGVEWCLVSKEGYGGAIDFYVELDWKNGRKRSIVDLKTGKPNNEHAIQQFAYEKMLVEHGAPVDMVFTLHPTDYKDNVPKYTLKNYTDSTELAEIWLDILELYKKHKKPPEAFMSLVGVAKIKDFNPDDNIVFTDAIELMSKKLLDLLEEEEHEPVPQDDIDLDLITM